MSKTNFLRYMLDLQKLQVYIIKSVTKAVFSSYACSLVVLWNMRCTVEDLEGVKKITQSFQQAKENCTVAYSTVINVFFIFLYITLNNFKMPCSVYHYVVPRKCPSECLYSTFSNYFTEVYMRKSFTVLFSCFISG